MLAWYSLTEIYFMMAMNKILWNGQRHSVSLTMVMANTNFCSFILAVYYFQKEQKLLELLTRQNILCLLPSHCMSRRQELNDKGFEAGNLKWGIKS